MLKLRSSRTRGLVYNYKQAAKYQPQTAARVLSHGSHPKVFKSQIQAEEYLHGILVKDHHSLELNPLPVCYIAKCTKEPVSSCACGLRIGEPT